MDGLAEDALVQRLQAVLGDHDIPPGPPADDEPGVEPVIPPEVRAAVKAACVHTERYGTRWSGVVTVPRHRGDPPTVRHTDGPPCERAYLDAGSLWSATASARQE